MDDELLSELSAIDARLRVLESKPTPSLAQDWDQLLQLLGEAPGQRGFAPHPADQIAAVIAGLGGGLLDLQPKCVEALTRDDLHQKIDAAFKEKVGQVTGRSGTVAVDNILGGPDHRLVGPTHDLFRLFHAIKCVLEGRFEAAVMGVRNTKDSYRSGLPPYLRVDSPADALVLVLLHWAADFFSARSMPIPGWTKLAEADDQQMVAWLFRAYREGANLRALVAQFLSNLSGLAFIAIVLHIYRYIDMWYVTEKTGVSVDKLSLKEDLRFRWMSRNANLVALTLSTGNALVTNNFFAWNYMAFFKFFTDARAVETLLDKHHQELDARTDQLLSQLERGT